MVEIRIANTFSIKIHQMKPKKSSFFSINFPSFSWSLHILFLLYSIDLCTSLIIKALMVLILFLCSCLLTVYTGGKRDLGFLQETSAKFLGTLCINSWVGLRKDREIRLTSFWTTHCSTLTDFDSIKDYEFRNTNW